jgi:hypothetical protein
MKALIESIVNVYEIARILMFLLWVSIVISTESIRSEFGKAWFIIWAMSLPVSDCKKGNKREFVKWYC